MEEQDDLRRLSTVDVLEGAKRQGPVRQQAETGYASRFVTAADRFILWLSQHWLAVFNTLAFLYVGVPFLAPVMMHLDFEGPARIIYTAYRALCHQLPQRSWFLFGPKIAYRLPELMERAGGAVSGPWANRFIGNDAMGYKVALCQRDTAIYGAIFLSGMLYGLLRGRKKVRPLPWWAYIGLGIVPMGVDGGLQLLSYALPLLIPNSSISPYETTPLIRVVTGALFGWATVWLSYPYVQEAMDDIRRSLHTGALIEEQLTAEAQSRGGMVVSSKR